MLYPIRNQFEDLTQEQRDDLRAEILAEELIKMLIVRCEGARSRKKLKLTHYLKESSYE